MEWNWATNFAFQQLIHTLSNHFALKDLETLSYFLGIKVSYPKAGGMFLSQSKYIMDLLHRIKISEAKPITTPMVSGPILSALQGELFHDNYLHRNIVGALQYVTIIHLEIFLLCEQGVSIYAFFHYFTLTISQEDIDIP